MMTPVQVLPDSRTLIDALLEEQRDLTAVERFARWHKANGDAGLPASYRLLVPLTALKPGEQYAFEVDLDRCSGCKSCVTACHALNGLDEDETWRSAGLLHGPGPDSFQQTITTACHHCVDPACLNGCPVLAYDKDPLTGIVRHLDDQCIGCQYCVFMCPYEVPKYSQRLGIVRKCDMCHQRLAHAEGPACAQACPSEAIRITVVTQETVSKTFRNGDAAATANSFLPCSPEPAITLPTTRYVSARPLPPGLQAGDSHQVRLQAAHAPLVWMLVLTHSSAGAFAVLPVVSRMAQPALATMGLAALFLGLAGSILHLGRPQKAWRSFLGLRRSWLSREIAALGIFALLALVATTLVRKAIHVPALLWMTSIAGVFGVLCSGMTYHATRRECWRGELSVGRFLGTTAVLGCAMTWCATALASAAHSSIALMLALTTTVNIWRELVFLRRCPDDADLNDEVPADLPARSAFLMLFRLGLILRLRLACAWLGGIALPLLSLIPGSAQVALAATSVLLCLAGETAGRTLFFRAATVCSMPGSASHEP